jgi:hypothetical protein
MKTILTFAFVAFLAVTTSAVATNVHPSYTQSPANSCFNYFRAHRQANAAGLLWSVNQPGITSFVVERSYFGDVYEPVGEVACNGAGQHKFLDTEVFPGTIYYRVIAVKADGGTETSSVAVLRIVSRR